MFRRQRPETRLALTLALVALLCLVLRGVGFDEPWGRFLGGMSDSMPGTILILLWASRRLRRRRESPSAAHGILPERWAPAFLLGAGLYGLVRTHFSFAWDLPGLLGSLIGLTVTVFVWTLVDPAARQAVKPGPYERLPTSPGRSGDSVS